jgi:hypothetical protein
MDGYNNGGGLLEAMTHVIDGVDLAFAHSANQQGNPAKDHSPIVIDDDEEVRLHSCSFNFIHSLNFQLLGCVS